MYLPYSLDLIVGLLFAVTNNYFIWKWLRVRKNNIWLKIRGCQEKLSFQLITLVLYIIYH